MELPYPILLRISWELWWRFCVCLIGLVLALLLPFAIVGTFYPIVWEAIAASRLDRELVLFGFLPAFQMLVCYPIAVKWFLRKRAEQMGVSATYSGTDRTIRDSRDRQIFLHSWAIFWMPLVWTLANALLIVLLFPPAGYPVKTIVAIAVITANVALVKLVAVLPMNVQWALRNSLLGTHWALHQESKQGEHQGR